MRGKAEKILLEIEGLKATERNSFLNGTETVKNLWSDLDRLSKQLKIIMKAGDFDDIGEREIPIVLDKIRIKRSDLLAFISIEKAREVITPASEPDLNQSKDKVAKAMGTQLAALRAVPEKQGPLGDLTDWFDANRSGIESFCATTFIVIIIQLSLNVFLVNQVKINTQMVIIEPLEQQLQMTESKNIEMAKRLSNMKKEIGLYRSLMKNMPFGQKYKKNSKLEFIPLELPVDSSQEKFSFVGRYQDDL